MHAVTLKTLNKYVHKNKNKNNLTYTTYYAQARHKYLPNAQRYFTCNSAFALSHRHFCIGVFDHFPGFLLSQCPQMPCACMSHLQAFCVHFYENV